MDKNENIRRNYQNKFRAIMVDEAQDLNVVQIRILNHLINNNICLIGDDCQNIYEWRGSSNELVFQFEEKHKKIILEDNYRSTGNIIQAVNKTIKSMKFKIPKYKYQTKRQRGFTILESLVAIVVLSLSISGAFSAVQQGLSQSIVAKDEIKAFYLAQEAIEVIRNRRDVNQLYKIDNPTTLNTWLYGIAENSGDDCYFGKTCRIDSPAQTIAYCGGAFNTCPRLKQDPNTGLFGYTSGWTDTIFRRGIQFTEVVVNREVRVTIEMNWTSRWGEKSFQVTETLFNRQ